MDKLKTIRTYYEQNIAKDLPEYGILGWESEEAQKLRFDMLLSSVSLEGKSILDVGCGTGNLMEHLNAKGIRTTYTGVDLLEEMIRRAQDKNLDGRFLQADIFKSNPFTERSFDVIYTSGIFNLNLGNNSEFLKQALELFFRLAREAVVFNLLHCNSPDCETKYYYFRPDEVAALLEGSSSYIAQVEFVEAYLKNDFTVVCRLK